MTYLVAVVVVWLGACFAVGLWFRVLDRQEARRRRGLDVIVSLDWQTPADLRAER
jgi:hypothetical protein